MLESQGTNPEIKYFCASDGEVSKEVLVFLLKPELLPMVFISIVLS